MDKKDSEEITKLLERLSAGDRSVEEQVVELVYKDLRHLARIFLAKERNDHTLQPTALVHEAYLRLTKQTGMQWQNRGHFLAMAASAMRRILVDHARTVHAAKRSGIKIPLDSVVIRFKEQSGDLLALDEALEQLAERDPRQAKIVEMRFFAGLSMEEIAEALDLSLRTVKRDWSMARAWLYGVLTKAPAE